MTRIYVVGDGSEAPEALGSGADGFIPVSADREAFARAIGAYEAGMFLLVFSPYPGEQLGDGFHSKFFKRILPNDRPLGVMDASGAIVGGDVKSGLRCYFNPRPDVVLIYSEPSECIPASELVGMLREIDGSLQEGKS